MSTASGTGAAPRTRPKLLVAVALAGALGVVGIRVVGGGSDTPATIDQLASPAMDDAGTAEPITTDATTVPAATVPAASTTTLLVATRPDGSLSTIPWTTAADGTHREPFTFLPVPADDAVDDASTAAVDTAEVPVPTVVGTIASGTGVVDTTDTTDPTDTTVPEETTTTRSPTLGLVTRPAGGYWLFQADGSVYASRPDTWFGDLRAVTLTSPVVGMQATPTGRGYYLVSRDGGVFAFGDAVYDGSIPETLARQLESMLDDGYLAPTTTTRPPKHR